LAAKIVGSEYVILGQLRVSFEVLFLLALCTTGDLCSFIEHCAEQRRTVIYGELSRIPTDLRSGVG
jgi:hypothetical protein